MRDIVTIHQGAEQSLAVQFGTLASYYDNAARSLEAAPLRPSAVVPLIGRMSRDDLFGVGQELGYSVTACKEFYLFMGTVIAL